MKVKILLLCAFFGIWVQAAEISDICDVETIVKNFAPLVKLSGGERYNPSSFSWYLNRVALLNSQLSVIKKMGEVTPQDLATYSDAGNFLDPEGKAETYLGESLQKDKVAVPIYINYKIIDDNNANVQCIFFYPFNGATPPLKIVEFFYPCTGISGGNHEADVEHVDIFLEKRNGTIAIKNMYFSRHGDDGNFLEKSDLKFVKNSNHPIVYSAKYGHASYGHTYPITRYLDVCNGTGAQWEGWKNYEILDRENPPPQQEWIKYAGLLGVSKKEENYSWGTKDAARGLAPRSWFNKAKNN